MLEARLRKISETGFLYILLLTFCETKCKKLRLKSKYKQKLRKRVFEK